LFIILFIGLFSEALLEKLAKVSKSAGKEEVSGLAMSGLAKVIN
jgi:hypothetical protein